MPFTYEIACSFVYSFLKSVSEPYPGVVHPSIIAFWFSSLIIRIKFSNPLNAGKTLILV